MLMRYLLQDTRVTIMKRLTVICGTALLAAGLSGCAYDPAPYGTYGYGPRYYGYAPPVNYGYAATTSYGYSYVPRPVYVAPTYGPPVHVFAGWGGRDHGGWSGGGGGGGGSWGGGHGGWGGGHGNWGGGHGGWGGGHGHWH